MTYKLKPQIKKLWIKALKSGKYNQGKGALCNINNQFCCLGVLCDLHRIKVLKKGKHVWKKSSKGTVIFSYLDNNGILPRQVANWAYQKNNFSELNPIVNDRVDTLSSLNDSNTSFETIADIIEKQL